MPSPHLSWSLLVSPRRSSPLLIADGGSENASRGRHFSQFLPPAASLVGQRPGSPPALFEPSWQRGFRSSAPWSTLMGSGFNFHDERSSVIPCRYLPVQGLNEVTLKFRHVTPRPPCRQRGKGGGSMPMFELPTDVSDPGRMVTSTSSISAEALLDLPAAYLARASPAEPVRGCHPERGGTRGSHNRQQAWLSQHQYNPHRVLRGLPLVLGQEHIRAGHQKAPTGCS